eukprot:5823189-Prymnesium_polylepis.1
MQMYESLKTQHSISFAYGTVKDLLNGFKRKIKDKEWESLAKDEYAGFRQQAPQRRFSFCGVIRVAR